MSTVIEPADAVVDYFFAPQSPWCYLGHQRFMRIAAERRLSVAFKPVDVARVFAAAGGLPLAQRPAPRRSYRLLEMARYAKHLALPMNLQPRHFPVAGERASLACIAADAIAGSDAALVFARGLTRAVWVEKRDIADPATLDAIAVEAGLDAAAVDARAATPEVRARYDAYTDEAIAAEVFGVPTYVPRFGPARDERFWGQDRLALLEEVVAS